VSDPLPYLDSPANNASLPLPVAMPAKLPRHRRSFFAIIHIDGMVQYPEFKPLGYLTQSRMIRAAKNGDIAARNRLWMQHCRLALTAVNRHRVPWSQVPDAVQAAQFGLIDAIDGFDIGRLTEFSTYAYPWVRQKLLMFRTQLAYHVSIPAYLFPHYMRFRHSFRKGQSGNEWYDAFESWQTTPKVYNRLKRLHRLIEPLQWSRDLEPATTETDPEHQHMATEAFLAVRNAIASLDEREQQIITQRYGLNGSEEHTLREIGEFIGLTRERVRQIQAQAEERLRQRLADYAACHPN